MPGCLSHSIAISGLRGKGETSISQGDSLSGLRGFWKGCHDSSKAAQSLDLWSQPKAGRGSPEPLQMFLGADVAVLHLWATGQLPPDPDDSFPRTILEGLLADGDG